MVDYRQMERALQLAKKGLGHTSPNPMVGAVITDEKGNIMGEGYHQKAGTPHAEVHALNAAGDRAIGGTLYVNLEPCSHYGRTPPCTEAIIQSGINKVVVGMVDPNPLVAGRGLKILADHGIQVVTGVMEREAKELNKAFIKYITTGRPFVTLKVAMTLDGKIAATTGDSKWITGEPAREKVHLLRHQVDAIMVGINTVLVDNPSLTTRLKNGEGKDPVRVILDSKLRLPLDSNLVVQESAAKTLVITGQGCSTQKKQLLVERGVEVVEGPLKDGVVDLAWTLEWLGEKAGVTHLLLEGGSEVIFSAIKEEVIDELWWFVAPKIIGGKTAPTPVGGAGIELMKNAYQVDNMTMEKVGEDILIVGYPVRGR